MNKNLTIYQIEEERPPLDVPIFVFSANKSKIAAFLRYNSKKNKVYWEELETEQVFDYSEFDYWHNISTNMMRDIKFYGS